MAVKIGEPYYKDTMRAKMRGRWRLKLGCTLFWPQMWPNTSEKVRARITRDGRDHLTGAPREFVVDFSANPLEHLWCDGQADKLEPAPSATHVSEIVDPRALSMMQRLGIIPPPEEPKPSPQDVVQANARRAVKEAQKAAREAGLPEIPGLDLSGQEWDDGGDDDLVDKALAQTGLEALETALATTTAALEAVDELKMHNAANDIRPDWIRALADHDRRAIARAQETSEGSRAGSPEDGADGGAGRAAASPEASSESEKEGTAELETATAGGNGKGRKD